MKAKNGRLMIRDTLERRLVEFTPLRNNEVRMYTCGPSTYAEPHLGNFRTYVFEDAVKRAFLFRGWKVRHVMNITDIEDKSVSAARGNMRKMLEITGRNERKFKETALNLNMLPPYKYPRATENVPYMVKMIKKLIDRGLAYGDADGCVLYDVSRFGPYGRLSRARFRHGLDGRVYKDDYYQHEAGDFVLWKAWSERDGDIAWSTSLGRGRPGWHVECSAMSARYLGVPFDLHMGGYDNIFAHHENEIAQTEGATGNRIANHWLHVRHLVVNGRKMSKSKGNYHTVDDMRRLGYGYGAIRAYLLWRHYRKRLNFTFAGLKTAARRMAACRRCVALLRRITLRGNNPEADMLADNALREFVCSINSDLDMPRALDTLCSFVRAVEPLAKRKRLGRENANKALAVLGKMDSVLGVLC